MQTLRAMQLENLSFGVVCDLMCLSACLPVCRDTYCMCQSLSLWAGCVECTWPDSHPNTDMEDDTLSTQSPLSLKLRPLEEEVRSNLRCKRSCPRVRLHKKALFVLCVLGKPGSDLVSQVGADLSNERQVAAGLQLEGKMGL